MGNSENKAKILEENLLSLSGLNIYKDIQVFDVNIDFRGDNFIHTIKCGDGNLENLVLIHGFGGSGVMFYKMLKDLSQTYKVYSIDLLGMGLSSRPNFDCTTTKETIDYFIDSIEKWRIGVGLEKFILAGHSFGGYMSCQYAVKYSSYVTKLILISPLGFTKDDIHYSYIEESKKEMGFWERRFFNMRCEVFQEKSTISKLYSKYRWIINIFAKSRLAQRFKISKEDAGLLYDFITETFKMEDSSQKSIFYIVNPKIIAYLSLEDCISSIKIPIVCFYGKNDWMNDKGAKRVNDGNMENFKLIYIEDSGHQIMMENSKSLTKYFIELNQLKENNSILRID